MGLLDYLYSAAQKGAGLLAPNQNDVNLMANMPGLIADFTPVLGDAKSAYDGLQSARQGDWLGAGLGAVGALPFVPSMGGVTKNLYHGTHGIFDKFDHSFTNDLGFHFGNKKQASTFIGDNGKLLNTKVTLNNPIEMPDLKRWNFETLAPELEKLGIKVEKAPYEYKTASSALNYKDQEMMTNKAIMDALKSKGYDGIVYKNGYEGSGKSYIAFDPEQVVIK